MILEKSQFRIFQRRCTLVNEEYEVFTDRAHLVLQYLKEFAHDISSNGAFDEDEVLPRVGALFALTNSLLASTFYKEFASYLEHDGALDRFVYKDLSLNPPIALDQPITRLTQALITDGGITDPCRYRFYLMKILSLYDTTVEMDNIRLQRSYIYQDVTRFFYSYRTTMRKILQSATFATPWTHVEIHHELKKIIIDFEVLLQDH